MNEPLVSIENLHVRFRTYAGQVHAVNGVSLDIRPGEIFGLVGETGCGKTVTGLSLLRLVPSPGEITAGRITFDGQDILSLSEQEMRDIRGARIAMIFQDPAASLNPVFTAGEQIEMVIRQHQPVSRRVARQRTLEMLEAVGLPDPPQIVRAYPHELSGGMQQRVMIGLALASNASRSAERSRRSLLIADEPTTALDVTIQAQILTLLTQLRESRGLSILLITHNLGVVAETCDRVAVLYVGHVMEKGRARDIFKEMKHPYTQGLLAAIPRPGSHGEPLQAISGSVPSGLGVFPGCSFEPRCPSAMEVCRQAPPPLVRVGEEHYVACYQFVEGVSKSWSYCHEVI
ncbi:MAG: ABC transporter ATP-binding protein [Anaerolineae bacterium]|nr:ABC transporter ATP-binding protein [Anaerolineae bacterium]